MYKKNVEINKTVYEIIYAKCDKNESFTCNMQFLKDKILITELLDNHNLWSNTIKLYLSILIYFFKYFITVEIGKEGFFICVSNGN